MNTDMVCADKMELGATGRKNDMPLWESMDYGSDAAYTKLARYTLSRVGSTTSTSGSDWGFKVEELSPRSVDFTSINPAVSCKKHRYMYTLCGSSTTVTTPVQALMKYDTVAKTETVWFPLSHEFLGEPMFIPRKGSITHSDTGGVLLQPGIAEDDGYIGAYLVNGRDRITELVLFDAKDITKGPLSRTKLPTFIPFGLHGSYADGLTFDEEDIIRKFKVNKALDSKRWNEVNSGFSGLGISYDF